MLVLRDQGVVQPLILDAFARRVVDHRNEWPIEPTSADQLVPDRLELLI